MLYEGEERAFTVVERDEVDIVEHSRVRDSAQFRVHIAAADRYRQIRMALLKGLRDEEGTIQIARKRYGETDQRWIDAVVVLPERFQQPLISETRRFS